jgi:hypothetical protein
VQLVRRAASDCRSRAGGRKLKTYKQLFGSGAKRGLFGRVLHVCRHVDEIRLARLLVELGLERGQERVAGHWSAAGAGAVLAGGRIESGRIESGRIESGRIEGRRGEGG